MEQAQQSGGIGREELEKSSEEIRLKVKADFLSLKTSIMQRLERFERSTEERILRFQWTCIAISVGALLGASAVLGTAVYLVASSHRKDK